MKGLTQQLQTINIKEFAKKSRLTQGQAALMIDLTTSVWRAFTLPTVEERWKAMLYEFTRMKPLLCKEYPALVPLLDFRAQKAVGSNKKTKLSNEEAFKVGQVLVKFLFDTVLYMGQGSYFERLNDMLREVSVIKDMCVKIYPRPVSKQATHEFIKGMAQQLKATNINSLTKNAHLTLVLSKRYDQNL